MSETALNICTFSIASSLKAKLSGMSMPKTYKLNAIHNIHSINIPQLNQKVYLTLVGHQEKHNMISFS